MAELTPMMKQYKEIHARHPDCLLFFRLGDFYEMFDEDARVASRELDLTLTTRDRGKAAEDQTPMCGVPFHSAESYIARLVEKGYKVAICEQMEDPALAKGLVERDVLRIITPGTVMDSSMLEERRANYISTVYLTPETGVCCFADISTGEFLAAEFPGEDAPDHLVNELVRYAPAEVILNDGAAANQELRHLLSRRLRCMCQTGSFFGSPESDRYFTDHFGSGQQAGPGIRTAAGALLNYLHQTQKTELGHLNELSCYTNGHFMELDWQTRRNLELTETLRNQERKGSLLWVLDRTKTSMGARLLRSWLEKPLLSPALIKRRLNAVSELVDGNMVRGEVREALRRVEDMERLIGRAVYGSASSRDLSALASSAAVLPELKRLLQPMKCSLLRELAGMDALETLRDRVGAMLGDDLPLTVREGGMIRPGYDPEVDRLRSLSENAKAAVAGVEAAERERTGIRKLKIGYNKVFGYYIEIPRSQSEEVPEHYIRKQTLVNGERFITQELKDLESQLLTAHDRLCALEYSLFRELMDSVAAQAPVIRQTAEDVAALDALCSLGEVAAKNDYCMPEVDVSGVIDIRDGRHPVVEQTQTEALFVPNDTRLDTAKERALILTGPNMAGKSTYLRQTALIVLMAQIGSFVPARSARIGITDRIFTRIGASDDLAAGQSTFMVEMTEVSQILQNATAGSLLILDEIGRGTSTYDGMAIARAVLEYCADPRKLGARTMFATHYHELTELEKTLPGVVNLSAAVKKRGEDVVFLRRIVPGGADRSYGIEVAKLAGVPAEVIRRARVVLKELERSAVNAARDLSGIPDAAEDDTEQLGLPDLGAEKVLDKLRDTDLNTLTPLEAMNLLFTLKKTLTEGS